MRRHQCILCAKDVDLEDRGTRWKAHGTLVTIRAARVLDYPVIAADRQRDRCGVAVACNVRQAIIGHPGYVRSAYLHGRWSHHKSPARFDDG